MNKFIFLLIIFLISSSCKTIKQALGVDKDPPDAFLIKKTNPIERPPNYDLIPPDSKVKKQKNSSDNIKSFIDKNLTKNSIENGNIDNTGNSSTIEDDLLKKINNK